MKKTLTLLIILLVTLSSSWAQVIDINPGGGSGGSGNDSSTPPSGGRPNNPSPFPSDLFERLGNSISDDWDDAGTKLSASIFESLTNRELFNTQIAGDLSVGVRVQRRVFNNQDIVDSWTVVDVMKVPFYLPIPLLSEELGFANGAFGINVGLSFGGHAYHIRQISPKDWEKLRSVDNITQDLKDVEKKSEEISEDIKEENENNPEGTVLNQDDPTESDIRDGLSRWAFWKTQNPRIRAQYNKLWNIITHPLKIPLTAERMDKYRVGSVASYGLEGAVQLGVNAGWSNFSVAGTDFTQTQAGLGITTYVKGDFRVSVWKESQQYSRVKLTRELNKGTSANVGTFSVKQELFEGFMVLDQNLFKIKEEFIPFSFTINRNIADQFEIGYRYDMTKPEARQAYEEACLGRFKLSYTLSQEEDSGVVESFTKVSQTRSRNRNYKMKLSLFFEKASSNSNSKTWASITMDDEEHRLFSAQNLTFKGYDSLWGKSEIKKHLFLTTYNELHNRLDPEKGLAMRIEGRIDDSDTTSKELYQYIDEVEVAIGKRDFFPRAPVYLPKLECEEISRALNIHIEEEKCQEQGDRKKKKVNYGKTSFFYQVDLTMEHLRSIQQADEKTFWSVMERAFGVEEGEWKSGWKRSLSLVANGYATILNIPLAFVNVNLHDGGRLVVAYRFYRKWKKLKKITDKIELVNAFGDLYKTLHYSPDLVKATRLLAGETSARYFLTAKADRLWGQISEGNAADLNNPFPVQDELNRRIEYDRIGPRINVDKEALISGLSFEKVDLNTAKITFNLKKKAKWLYLRVDQSPGWGRYKNLLRMIIKNNGEFKKGENVITIKRDEENGYLKKLSEAFFNGRYSTFMMAYSIQEKDFGAVSSVRFKLESEADLESTDFEEKMKLADEEL